MTSSEDPRVPNPPGGQSDFLVPADGSQTPPEQQPPPRGRFARAAVGVPVWLIVTALLVAIIGSTGYFVHIPYFSVGPGPAVDVLTLIDVQGGAKTYPSRGKLLLTTASESVGTVNLWDALYAWVDPNTILIPRSDVIPPGVTNKEQDIENRLEMEESKFQAEVAAFRALGFKIQKIPGARILTVVDGSPAFGKLRAHDLIVSVDGTPVNGRTDAIHVLSKHSVGDEVVIGFKRGESLMSVKLKTIASDAKPVHAVIGVTLSTAFQLPHDIEIDTQNIVGPSGGLMFALAIYDAFTSEDLTGGHIIAGTGEMLIDPTTGAATVGDIGAIEEKVRGASAVGADIFLAPADQAAAAHKVAPKGIRVIGVHTLSEAIQALKALKPLAQKAA
ncbi:MAG: YlbL family protein [Actinomycetota bacterium]